MNPSCTQLVIASEVLPPSDHLTRALVFSGLLLSAVPPSVSGTTWTASPPNVMASPVTELEAGLQAMLNLKPPGVSGYRFTSLTSLCVSIIQVRALADPSFSHQSSASNCYRSPTQFE